MEQKRLKKTADEIQKKSLKLLEKFPSDEDLKKRFPKIYPSLISARNLLKEASGASKMSADQFKKFFTESQDVIKGIDNNLQKALKKDKSCIQLCYEEWQENWSKCKGKEWWDPCWAGANWTKFLCDLNCFIHIGSVSVTKKLSS